MSFSHFAPRSDVSSSSDAAVSVSGERASEGDGPSGGAEGGNTGAGGGSSGSGSGGKRAGGGGGGALDFPPEFGCVLYKCGPEQREKIRQGTMTALGFMRYTFACQCHLLFARGQHAKAAQKAVHFISEQNDIMQRCSQEQFWMDCLALILK